MYRSVLLTDREISLLKRVVGDYLNEKLTTERQNLTIIHNRLRDIVPLKKYNQTIN
jgi:hypothetical protein